LAVGAQPQKDVERKEQNRGQPKHKSAREHDLSDGVDASISRPFHSSLIGTSNSHSRVLPVSTCKPNQTEKRHPSRGVYLTRSFDSPPETGRYVQMQRSGKLACWRSITS
jgi:hypothetical protein